MDVAETSDGVTVTAELPGVDPGDVEVTVVGNVLTIRGEKRELGEHRERSYHYVERRFGAFHRALQLPGTVDPEKVDAVFRNGILKVRVPKLPDAKLKRITVRTT